MRAKQIYTFQDNGQCPTFDIFFSFLISDDKFKVKK